MGPLNLHVCATTTSITTPMATTTTISFTARKKVMFLVTERKSSVKDISLFSKFFSVDVVYYYYYSY